MILGDKSVLINLQPLRHTASSLAMAILAKRAKLPLEYTSPRFMFKPTSLFSELKSRKSLAHKDIHVVDVMAHWWHWAGHPPRIETISSHLVELLSRRSSHDERSKHGH
ncbi:hypothetical protein AC1031_010733 [Aphanomyces cochlioides]|nr:hypothetical protein AC1031_010733 [Aphanomyces cochlioides]